jgi:hypothetical protein
LRAKEVEVDGARRSPGFASKHACMSRSSIGIHGLPGNFQWPRAMSSLTVARQRGICTRFPVFAQRRRRAFLSLERAGQRTESDGREEGSQIGQAAVGVTGILHRYVTWVEDSSRSNDVVYISPALCYPLAA